VFEIGPKSSLSDSSKTFEAIHLVFSSEALSSCWFLAFFLLAAVIGEVSKVDVGCVVFWRRPLVVPVLGLDTFITVVASGTTSLKTNRLAPNKN